MADDDGEEKTQDPTAKRQKDFAERGEVAKSQEVAASAGLLFAALAVTIFAGDLGAAVRNTFVLAYARIGTNEGDINAMLELLRVAAVEIAVGLAPLLLFLWATGLFVGLYQQWGAFPKEPFKFDPNKFNPITGFQQKFMSTKPLIELLKSVIKILLIGYLCWGALVDRFDLLPALAGVTPGETLKVLEDLAWMVLWRALPVAIVIAFLDYLYESYQINEKMKMTRKEVKDEHKDQEGDPHVKQARKRRQHEMAFARTVQNVKKADIVITNPDHYAVALRYRKSEAAAPIVVAKGVDRLAQAIKAEAARHDIPQIENRPLARALHARVKEGKMVPADLYDAVARVLAVVWRRRRPAGL
jgi:flagellar biosynthetic protein FlhB